MSKTWCMSCGEESELTEAYRDRLGWHTVCPCCGASYDIDAREIAASALTLCV